MPCWLLSRSGSPCDSEIDRDSPNIIDEHDVHEEWNDSLRSDAYALSLLRMLSEWLTTKNRQRLRRAAVQLLLDLENA